MTHAELVQRAAKWLKRSCGCRVVLTERGIHETPDAIGWLGTLLHPTTYVVECKVSRADFHADAQKVWRTSISALGRHRFYMTPPGLVTPDEVPRGWGLLEVHPRSIYTRLGSMGFELTASSIEAERSLLLSELAIYHANGIGYPTLTGRPALPHLAAARADDGRVS